MTITSNTRLLCMPKEILLEILYYVTLSDGLYPTSLIKLSNSCRYLFELIKKNRTLWSRIFHYQFDTIAIYRRNLNSNMNWQHLYLKRINTLNECKQLANTPDQNQQYQLLKKIDWQIIWDLITEHDHNNLVHLLNYNVQFAAGTAFQLCAANNDRSLYPVVLPILSLLVNYDFSIAKYLNTPNSLVCDDLNQFAYNFEADTTITTNGFYPSQDYLSSSLHLFFTTIFAHHPNIYQAIPNCLPIPLFQLNSSLFDYEYLKRTQNQYQYVTQAHLIEGDWIGYYTFQDPEDSLNMEDWFDGPMRITIKIVPLDDTPLIPHTNSQYPYSHITSSPLTRFEGTGIDNLGTFSISGLIDDTEDGQITWEKNYVDSGETWEYSGKFVWPMGLCGRWGDEEYGGPWWIWKVSDSKEDHLVNLLATK